MLTIDHPTDPGVDLGPVIDADAFERVGSLLSELAAEEGDLSPAATDVPDDGWYAGPVVALVPPTIGRRPGDRGDLRADPGGRPRRPRLHPAPALAAANDSEYALTAGVFPPTPSDIAEALPAPSTPATSTSTAAPPVRWSPASPSVATSSPAPAPRRAAPTTSCASPPRSSSPRTLNARLRPGPVRGLQSRLDGMVRRDPHPATSCPPRAGVVPGTAENWRPRGGLWCRCSAGSVVVGPEVGSPDLTPPTGQALRKSQTPTEGWANQPPHGEPHIDPLLPDESVGRRLVDGRVVGRVGG